MIERKIVVTNPVGLHARPAAQFVKTSSQYRSTIKVRKENVGDFVNAKSILSVLTLGVDANTAIELRIEGEDEQQAADALQKLIESDFA